MGLSLRRKKRSCQAFSRRTLESYKRQCGMICESQCGTHSEGYALFSCSVSVSVSKIKIKPVEPVDNSTGAPASSGVLKAPDNAAPTRWERKARAPDLPEGKAMLEELAAATKITGEKLNSTLSSETGRTKKEDRMQKDRRHVRE